MSPSDLIRPYAELHKSPSGPGDARPTALQIIRDENLTNVWPDKTVLITGGSSGIGVETARALHATGARIFITTRKPSQADAVIADILSTSPSHRPIEIISMELGSLASVRAGALDFLSRSDKLNILINNAGIMATPRDTTADGFEIQLGTNHLSHFLLTELLLPTLIASSMPAFASRVINVASEGHHYAAPGFTPAAFEDLNFKRTEYNEWLAYGRSKLANMLHANQIERLCGTSTAHPLHAFSLHPGGISTALWRHQGEAAMQRVENSEFSRIWKSAEQGAATSVWCAAAMALEGRRGGYCEDCGEAEWDRDQYQVGEGGYASFAKDEVTEQKLWEVSEELVRPWAGEGSKA